MMTNHANLVTNSLFILIDALIADSYPVANTLSLQLFVVYIATGGEPTPSFGVKVLKISTRGYIKTV